MVESSPVKLFLASASPRRAAILQNAGIDFEAHPPMGVDETFYPGETAEQAALRLAETKARLCPAGLYRPAIVIGADTIVVIDGELLAKPASPEDARRMLRRLAGRTHLVVTGVTVLRLPDRAMRRGAEFTEVAFAPLSDREIEAYVATGEPMDKAGAYGIQERGGRFVTGIAGCYFNVMGLPLARLCRMLKELGWEDRPASAGP